MGQFEGWYRPEHPRLLTAMVVVCGDLEVARDVTAEAFTRALERWGRVEAMDNPAGWTYTVALNLARRRWRPGGPHGCDGAARTRGRAVETPAIGADSGQGAAFYVIDLPADFGSVVAVVALGPNGQVLRRTLVE